MIRFLVTVPYPLEAELKAGVAPGVRIDPNSAPWWELTALPGIGEVTAKKIVAYRDAERAAHNLEPDEPVFRTLADLQGVRGIGPKKAEAVRDVVVLPAEPDESSRSR